MNIDTLIFDFDGVVVDSEPLHCKAFQAVLGPLGIHFTWEEYLRDYVGFDDRDALRFAFSSIDDELDPVRMESLIAEKAREFSRLASAPEVELYPGLRELLSRFHGNVPMAICSGALLQDITPVADRFGIRDFFEFIVTADQVKKSKPDPESYCVTFDLLQDRHGPLDKGAAIVIEDTPAGLASAKSAGLHAVGVTHTHPPESLHQADFIAETLMGVQEYLLST